MAIYAQFDESGPCLQVASNEGWSEFGDWVETLKEYPRITALWNEGSMEDVPGLREEVERAIEDDAPPSKDVEDIAHQIIHAIDAAGAAEIMLVTAGVSIEPPAKDN